MLFERLTHWCLIELNDLSFGLFRLVLSSNFHCSNLALARTSLRKSRSSSTPKQNDMFMIGSAGLAN